MNHAIITISEAAREAGISRWVLMMRLVRRGIDPVERRGGRHGDLYRRDEVMPVAREPLQRGRPKGYKVTPRAHDHIGEKCSRCGQHDYGNECRRGLCLDCFCHDYCKERRL